MTHPDPSAASDPTSGEEPASADNTAPLPADPTAVAQTAADPAEPAVPADPAALTDPAVLHDPAVLAAVAEPAAVADQPSAGGGLTTDLAVAGPELSVGRRKGPILLAAGVVVAILLGVGAFVGYQFLFGTIRPAERIPASVVAYVSLDFDPSLDQQTKLIKLASKLSGNELAPDAEGLLDQALREIDPGLADLDVKRDIASWLGLRIGIGAWLDGKEPYAVIVAASEDDDAAREGLSKISAQITGMDFGYVVKDRAAVIAIGSRNAQRAAEAAAAEADSAPLAEAASYRDALKWLGDDQLIVGFADMGRYTDLMGAMLGPELSGMLTEQPKSDQLTGTYVMGLSATDDGFEARYRAFGDAPTPSGLPDALARLGGLPKESTVAAVAKLPDDLGEQVNSPFSPLSGVLGGMFASTIPQPSMLMPEEFDPEQPGGFPPGFNPEDFEELSPEELDALKKQLEKEFGQMPGGFDPNDPDFGSLDPDFGPNPGPSAFLAQLEQIYTALSGATLGLALSGTISDETRLSITADTTSPENAKVLAELAEGMNLGLRIDVAAGKLTMTTPEYVPGSATLADDPMFQRVTADGPQDITAAVYFNLDAIPAAERSDFRALKAIGFIQGVEDGDAVGVLRVLIG